MRFCRLKMKQNKYRRAKKIKMIPFLICALYQLFFGPECRIQRPKRMWWVHPMNAIRGQPGRGEFHAQIQELKMYWDHFMGYFRMPLNKYFELLNRIKTNCKVAKQNTNWRKCIGIEERLAVFLR